MQLQSKHLSVELTTMDGNPTSRFDHFPYVFSIVWDSCHAFLSTERTKAGPGTRGAGLMHGFLNAPEMDADNSPGRYPLVGIGVATIQQENYSVRETYPCDFALVRTVSSSATSARFSLFQEPSDGFSYEMTRSFDLSDDTLCIATTIKNLGKRAIIGKQYCHNFFLFDQCLNGPSYKLVVPGCHDLQMVRGSVIFGGDWYRPNQFDENLGTMALTYQTSRTDGEELWITNDRTGTSVKIENDFPVLERYHWHSPWCVCPETFVSVNIKKGQAISFSRSYLFGGAQ